MRANQSIRQAAAIPARPVQLLWRLNVAGRPARQSGPLRSFVCQPPPDWGRRLAARRACEHLGPAPKAASRGAESALGRCSCGHLRAIVRHGGEVYLSRGLRHGHARTHMAQQTSKNTSSNRKLSTYQSAPRDGPRPARSGPSFVESITNIYSRLTLHWRGSARCRARLGAPRRARQRAAGRVPLPLILVAGHAATLGRQPPGAGRAEPEGGELLLAGRRRLGRRLVERRRRRRRRPGLLGLLRARQTPEAAARVVADLRVSAAGVQV